jgi:hypothetical protein
VDDLLVGVVLLSLRDVSILLLLQFGGAETAKSGVEMITSNSDRTNSFPTQNKPLQLLPLFAV